MTSGKDQNTRAPEQRNINESANPSDLAFTGRIQKNSVEPSGVLASNPIIQDAISKQGTYTLVSINQLQVSQQVMATNEKSSTPTAGTTFKVSSRAPRSSNRGGGSTSGKTGGGSTQASGTASNNSQASGTASNNSQASGKASNNSTSSKAPVNKHGRPISNGSNSDVKAQAAPIAPKQTECHFCFTCLKVACDLKKIRMPTTGDELVEQVRLFGVEGVRQKYFSSEEENGLCNIDFVGHQGTKRCVSMKNKPLNFSRAIDTTLPDDHWILVLLPTFGPSFNPSGEEIPMEVIDAIFDATRCGGSSKAGDILIIKNEKLLENMKYSLSQLRSIYHETCVSYVCAPSLISYCLMFNVPRNSEIIIPVFKLERQRQATIKMHQEAQAKGLEAGIKILGEDYNRAPRKEYLEFLVSELKTQLYVSWPLSQSFETKNESTDINGFEFALCKTIGNWLIEKYKDNWREALKLDASLLFPVSKFTDSSQFLLDDVDLSLQFLAYIRHMKNKKAAIYFHPDKIGKLPDKDKYIAAFKEINEIYLKMSCFLCTGPEDTTLEDNGSEKPPIEKEALLHYQRLISVLWRSNTRCQVELAKHKSICAAPVKTGGGAPKVAAKVDTKVAAKVDAVETISSALITVQLHSLVSKGFSEPEVAHLQEAAKFAPEQVLALVNSFHSLIECPDADQNVVHEERLRSGFASSITSVIPFELKPEDNASTLAIALKHQDIFDDCFPVLSRQVFIRKSNFSKYADDIQKGINGTKELDIIDEEEKQMEEIVISQDAIQRAMRDYKDRMEMIEASKHQMRKEIRPYANSVFKYLARGNTNFSMFIELISLFCLDEESRETINQIISEVRLPNYDPIKLQLDFQKCLYPCNFSGKTFYLLKGEIKQLENEINAKPTAQGEGVRALRADKVSHGYAGEFSLPEEQFLVTKFLERSKPAKINLPQDVLLNEEQLKKQAEYDKALKAFNMFRCIVRKSCLPKAEEKKAIHKGRFCFVYAQSNTPKEVEEFAELDKLGLVTILIQRPQDLKYTCDNELRSLLRDQIENQYMLFMIESIDKHSDGSMICANYFDSAEKVKLIAETAPVWKEHKFNHVWTEGKMNWRVGELYVFDRCGTALSPLIGVLNDEGQVVEIYTGSERNFTQVRNDLFEKNHVMVPNGLTSLWEATRKGLCTKKDRSREKVSHQAERRVVENQDTMALCEQVDELIARDNLTTRELFEEEFATLNEDQEIDEDQDQDDVQYQEQLAKIQARKNFLDRMLKRFSDDSELTEHIKQGEEIIRGFTQIDLRNGESCDTIEAMERQARRERISASEISELSQIFCDGYDLWTKSKTEVYMSKDIAMQMVSEYGPQFECLLGKKQLNILVKAVEKYFEARTVEVRVTTEDDEELVCTVQVAKPIVVAKQPKKPKAKKVVQEAIFEVKVEVQQVSVQPKKQKPSFDSKNERLRASGVCTSGFSFSQALLDDNSESESEDN